MALEVKIPMKRVDDVEVGKLYLYEYDPKWKAVLPYYDRYPLTFPCEMLKDGFLGLNMHYLPVKQRSALFNALVQVRLSDDNLDDGTHLMLSYEIIRGFGRMLSGYQQCLKHYLYNHVRSPYGYISPENWELALNAPLERWAARGAAKKK